MFTFHFFNVIIIILLLLWLSCFFYIIIIIIMTVIFYFFWLQLHRNKLMFGSLQPLGCLELRDVVRFVAFTFFSFWTAVRKTAEG